MPPRNVLFGAQGIALHEPHSQIWRLYRELYRQSIQGLEGMFGPERCERIVTCIEAAVEADAVLPVD